MTFPPSDSRGPLEGAETSSSEPRLLTRRDGHALIEGDAQASPHGALFSKIDRLRRKQATSEQPPSRRGRTRRVLRRIFLTWGVLALIVLLALLGGTIWLRHAMRAALPQVDGMIAVTGLTAEVTVTRDPQGVPSIHAATLDDLLFTQGFVTAQDRLFQMDALRRHSAGELAEVLGPSLIEHDRLQRYLQMLPAAERAAAVLPPDQLHQLEAYTRGVNAFIESHHDKLPVEFRLLHYQPAPWTPRDSLLIGLAINQDLATEFPQKVNREVLTAHLPPELVADLYPVGSWRDVPPAQQPPDLTIPHETVDQIPLDESQSSLRLASPDDLVQVSRMLHAGHCEDCRAGSNNWAVSGARSASGAPLLANDMHLNLSAPDIWYEAALHTTDPQQPLDVTGFTLPGVPFVIVGRNAQVAWGFTAMLADTQDLRIEHLRGQGINTEFEHADGTWSLAVHHQEVIRVRGGHDVSLDILATTHSIGTPNQGATIETPILSPLYPTEKRAISLAWPIYDPSTVRMPLMAAASARDGASLVAALATFGGPSLSLVYADAHHIGYHAVGRIPIRGPAIRHPRAMPETAAPTGAAPADEEDQPQALLDKPAKSPLMLATYERRGPRRRLTPRRVPALVPRKRLVAPPQRKTPDVPIAPEPAVRDYNIGSPISPVPVDALDSNQEWSGYVPYDEMPSVVDPASGVLATANARVTANDYPYFLSNDWVDPYRVERIHHLLEERTGLKPADMLAVENDVHSEFDLLIAQRLAYAIDHASPSALGGDARRLQRAADLLRQWDGDLRVDSSAATIVAATRTALWPMLLLPQIHAHDGSKSHIKPEALIALYTWNERDTALEMLLQHTPARWLPKEFPSWDDLLTAAAERGMHESHAPADLGKWQFGMTHPVEIAHPIFGSHTVLSRVLGVATGTGRHPAPGDATTIRASALHFGPSERFTADLADADASSGNITTGESGSPASEHFLDQFQPWLRGTTFPMPLRHAIATHTLTLRPR